MKKDVLKKTLDRKWHEVIKSELGCFEDYLLGTVNTDDAMLAAASRELISAGGKRIRPAFAWLSARFWGGRTDEQRNALMPLLAALELVHTASLVHDDIIDRAAVRRGRPTANFVYGDAAALYVGDYLIGRALELVAPYRSSRVNASLNHTVRQMCIGELRQGDDFFRTGQTYRDYFYRIRRKTALLFAGSCECGAALAGAAEADIDTLWRFGYDLGMAFQVIDDMLDLCGNEGELGKPAANDLRQGNLSLAVVYVLRETADSAQMAECVRTLQDGGVAADAALDDALRLVRHSGGLGFAADVAEKFLLRAEAELMKLPDVRERGLLLDIMRQFHGQTCKLAVGKAQVLAL